MKTSMSAALAAALSTAACTSGPRPAAQPETARAAAAATKPAVDLAAMDRTVDPCDDFYRFACGGWIKSTPVPADRALWNRSFSEILQRNELVLRKVLEDDAAGKADQADPYAAKAGDFYAACMDEGKAEAASLATLRATLASIEAVHDRKELAEHVAQLQLAGASALFSFFSTQDAKDARQVIGRADQGGLGMPDRNYYLKDEPKLVAIRTRYRETLQNLLVLAGDAEARAGKAAEASLRIEAALAKASLDRVERRDPYKVYHRLERAGLAASAPHFDWDSYFAAVGTPSVQAINVAVPAFFPAMDALAANAGASDLKDYLRAQTVLFAAPLLGKRFADEAFRFSSLLTGAKEDLPRWKRCVALTDALLGETVGRSFVARTFGKEGKEASLQLARGIEGAFARNLGTLSWMDVATRAQAKDKLDKVFNRIGYPDKWRSYEALQIDRGDALKSAMAAGSFEAARKLAKMGKPVDRDDWVMTPATVNAQYSASLNAMSFPAGILQDPFFEADYPLSHNAGGIGMVIGHELTHGFDDQGRQFDGDGNLRDWWSKESGAAYRERAECVAKQYDGYIAVDDQHLNGHLTNGENIADIGGLKLTYLAFKEARKNEPPLPEVGGFNEDQQLFLSFAQVWCANVRPEAARARVITDPHSSPEWRVNGPAADNEDFARIFSCKAGSRMAPQNRCTVW